LIDSQAQFIDYMVARNFHQEFLITKQPRVIAGLGHAWYCGPQSLMPAFEDILLCPSTSATLRNNCYEYIRIAISEQLIKAVLMGTFLFDN
jgi:hypothetical protein